MEKKTPPQRRRKTPVSAVHEESPAASPGDSFPIVGIGASAGGFEAIDQFLTHLPVGSGMAVVVVQHLDPTRKGLMAELLQRGTPMKVQAKILPLFHYSLTPGGALLLGNAETVGHFTDLFATSSVKARIFRRTESAVPPDPIEFPSSFAPAMIGTKGAEPVRKPYLNLQTQAEQLVLRRYAPPTVLVNEQGNVLYISSPTGKYLEPAVGKANLNIFAMAREGLRYELSAAFQKAMRQDGPVTLHGLKIGTNGGQQFVDVTVERLEEAEPLAGLLTIVFKEIPAPVETKAPPAKGKRPAANLRLAESERELLKARAELLNTREAMQSSQEELKSANEEMQSTNEEMQSTNEELTTSKEEMQSLNEELQTVNAELQGKLDELSRSNNDMKNLLNSTDIATLFLDNDLKVRRFTTQASKVIKLIPGDVGRPITDLGSDLLYPDLADDASEVLRKLGILREIGLHARRTLVHGAHQSLPHAGRSHRRRGDHLLGHQCRENAGGEVAGHAGHT